jgi:hypothetical protein
MFAISARLEDEGTGEVQRFEGALYLNGVRGELSRMEGRKAIPVVVWDLRDLPGRPERVPNN